MGIFHLMIKKLAKQRGDKRSRTPDAPAPVMAMPTLIRRKAGGALYSGGVPGHIGGGGRLPEDKRKRLERLALGPRAMRRLRKVLRTGDDRAFIMLWEKLMARAVGLPTARHEVETKLSLAQLLAADELPENP